MGWIHAEEDPVIGREDFRVGGGATAADRFAGATPLWGGVDVYKIRDVLDGVGYYSIKGDWEDGEGVLPPSVLNGLAREALSILEGAKRVLPDGVHTLSGMIKTWESRLLPE